MTLVSTLGPQMAASSISDALANVRVPATSANLGPGYDALGIALDVPMVAHAVPRREARVVAEGFGEGELPSGDDNLVWTSLRAWAARAGVTPPDISVVVRSAIPLERGMGSSSAAAVAGLLLAEALLARRDGVEPLGATELLRLATDLEGHPDNAAAALMGGLVLCLADGRVQRVTPTSSLRPVVLVPDLRQSTAHARAVLPTDVSLATAAGNAARAASTFAALAGIVPLSVHDMVDDLHEPARLELMPASAQLVRGLRARGIPSCLSGAGPAVLAVVPADAPAGVRQARAVAAECDLADVEVVPTDWDLAGARILPGPQRPR